MFRVLGFRSLGVSKGLTFLGFIGLRGVSKGFIKVLGFRV